MNFILKIILTIIICFTGLIKINAQFFVKNNLKYDIYVATATYHNPKPESASIRGWATEGWYRIKPNEKLKVVEEIQNRYVYIYAFNPYEGDLLMGETQFVVKNADTFKRFGPLWRCHGEWLWKKQDDEARAFYTIPLFKMVDVKDATIFTFTVQEEKR